MKIELIYFDGCPKVDSARANLKQAFETIGIKGQWQEWEQNNPEAPDYAQRFGSPSILVNGKDIANGPDDCCAPNSCRVYEGGTPSVEFIVSALKTDCCS